MKANYLILLLFAAAPTTMVAQTTDGTADTDDYIAGFFDSKSGSSINYSDFHLPPLSVLFENAKSNPSVEILAREEAIQRELLKQEKRSLLKFINGHANYTYGIMDNYGSNSSVISPIYYQYLGTRQHYWNLGASISVPLDEAFDYRGRIRRQRLNAEKARLTKEQEYENLKQQIATLYVRITNNLIALKTAGENAAAYKGAGDLTYQEFKMGDVTVRDLAETKRWENDAIAHYQTLQSTITTDILILEIITHTPIITNVIVNASFDDTKK